MKTQFESLIHGTISFVPYSSLFLDYSWNWLNDEEIKRLTNTPAFTREQQKNWFENLHQKTDYKIWGIEYNNLPIGVVGLKNIDVNGGEFFGYIGDKEMWNKGISKLMLSFIHEEAHKLQLKKVWLRVLKENERAINAYSRFGYTPFEQNDIEIFMHFFL